MLALGELPELARVVLTLAVPGHRDWRLELGRDFLLALGQRASAAELTALPRGEEDLFVAWLAALVHLTAG